MTIEQVVKVCKRLKLTPDQVLSMYYVNLGRKYPLVLTTKLYNDLVSRGLAEKNKPTKRYLNLVDDILNDIPKNAKTIKIEEKYEDILMNLFTVLDIKTLVDKDTRERVEKFFKEDDRLVSLYFTWLFLFPSNSEKKNKTWETLFGVKYGGVPLRKVVDSNLRNFRRIAYSKDLGVYIMATYLYIRDHIKDGKCFIPKITNFFEDQEDKYINVKAQLDPMKQEEVLNLFDLNENSVCHQINQAMAPGMIQG